MAGTPYNDNVKEGNSRTVEIKEPKWNKKPDYTSPLPKSNDAGKIPPRTQISAHGKDQPHTPSPVRLKGVE